MSHAVEWYPFTMLLVAFILKENAVVQVTQNDSVDNSQYRPGNKSGVQPRFSLRMSIIGCIRVGEHIVYSEDLLKSAF
ncbi:hypothetical protein Y1Q_0011636 [Alligator mississippiensis]|uniref:Secreted protein n=1 Tax=Alligator mississippiensis TaxID=8496 RepID=A0A151M0P6_ALLMI|nr:hypothetical protein Y1Q_0011636 [Alligator mississippiensis]